jgi:hypothetical protein
LAVRSPVDTTKPIHPFGDSDTKPANKLGAKTGEVTPHEAVRSD